jgi:hypothetical protein
VSGAGRLEVGRIDQRYGKPPAQRPRQQRLQQVLVDPPQSHDAYPLPKIVQHPHIRHRLAIGQMGKLAPGFLLGQHLDQQIERMHRGQ